MKIPWIHIKHSVVAAILTLLALVILWFSLWALGAAQYRDFIDDWIDSHRAMGYEITYDHRETAGFPRHIILHFSNFVLKNPDGVRVHANDVLLSSFPWHWSEVDAKLKHGFELMIPFPNQKDLLISTEQTVQNHTRLEDNGDWSFVDLQLEEAKALWGTEPFFAAGSFSVAFERPDKPPQNHTQTGLTFRTQVGDLTLPGEMSAPFGAKVGKIDVELRIMGAPPDPRKKDSVAAWNSAIGIVEFDKFYLEWGPLILSSRGTLGLDDDLQPEGAFSGQVGNYKEVIKVLMAHDYIPKRQQGMLDSALNIFAKKKKVFDTEGLEMPITVQLGGLFLGPVRVFEFQEIKWEGVDPETPDTPTLPAQ